MKNTRKTVIAGVLIALAVAGGAFSFPVLGAKCSPVQHMVNVLAAVVLGPWHGVIMAFITSVIRVSFGFGTAMAFPGSMCGALIAGISYKLFKNLPSACIGELLGTGIIGGLLAYPVALLIIGNKNAALLAYIVPFLISAAGGVIIASALILALKKTGFLAIFERQEDKKC